jgi:hypothetical protein
VETPTLLTVEQFCDKHIAFTYGGIRWLIFKRQTNGLQLAGAVVFIGRRVLIDEAKFFAWVEARSASASQKPHGSKKESSKAEPASSVVRAPARKGNLTVDVLRALRSSEDGLATEEICEMLGVSFESKKVHKVLQALCDNGFVGKEGNNRTARYFAVSGEGRS